jgi:hypothetical protein
MFAKAAIAQKIEPAPGTQGFICDPNHPALAEFPHRVPQQLAVVADRQTFATDHS